MLKKKLIFLLSMALFVFLLAGCGSYVRYNVNVEPYQELYEYGHVSIEPDIRGRYEEGEFVIIEAKIKNFPEGIKFEKWEVDNETFKPEKENVRAIKIPLELSRRREITIHFDVKENEIAVANGDDDFIFVDQPISEAAEGHEQLVVFPGEYDEDITIKNSYRSITSLVGPKHTQINGEALIEVGRLKAFEGFTVNSGEEPGITFEAHQRQELLIRNNHFNSEKAIVFEGDIEEEIKIIGNYFEGPYSIRDLKIKGFEKNDLETLSDMKNGIDFHGSIENDLKIEGNHFSGFKNSAVFFSNSCKGELIFTENIFKENGVGITFNNGELISPDIQVNNFYDNLVGILINQLEYLPTGKNFIKNNNFSGNKDFGLISDSKYKVDATNNWWGDSSGPSGIGEGDGDPIYGDIEYDPYETRRVFWIF